MSFKTWIARNAIKHSPRPVLRWAVNRTIGEYGHMLDLKIDLEARTLACTVHLAGEQEPLSIAIDDFDLSDDGTLTIRHATADRQWVQALLQNFLVGRAVPVPPDKIDLVRGILKH